MSIYKTIGYYNKKEARGEIEIKIEIFPDR